MAPKKKKKKKSPMGRVLEVVQVPALASEVRKARQEYLAGETVSLGKLKKLLGR